MSLTAGSTLQNGKYLIQATLYQGDFSVSYVAIHCLLGQTVIVQTLNDSLREHPRFESARQQLLAEVRRHITTPTESPARIRDFFEESGKPFVVLEHVPGQTPIQLSDWLKFLSPTILTADTAPPAASAPNGLHAPQPDPPSGGEHAAAPLNGAAAAPPPPAAQPIAPTVPTAPVLPALPTLAAAPPTLPPPAPPTPHKRQRRLLPTALALTAIASGCAGAGLGLGVRLQSAGDADPPALFSREQDFPPQTDWLGEDPYAQIEEADEPLEEYIPTDPTIERREVREYRRERSEVAEPPVRQRRALVETEAPPPIAVTEEEPAPEPDFLEADPLPAAEAAEPAPEPIALPDPAPPIAPVKTAPAPVVPAAEPPAAPDVPSAVPPVPEAIAQ